MHQSLWPYLMILANFLHPSFIPSQKKLTHRHSEEEPLRFECVGGLIPFLIGNPLVAFFSAFCSQARSPIVDEYFVI